MTGYQPNLIEIILVVATIGLIPLAVVTLTGFMKISVVLFLIRNALGVQQTPPNLVLYGIALILSVYVTTPLIGDMYRQVEGRDLNIEHVEQLIAVSVDPVGHGSDSVPHRNFTAPQLGMSQTGQTEQRDGCHQKYFFQHNCLCQDL